MSYSSICKTYLANADFGLESVLEQVVKQFGAFAPNEKGEMVTIKKFKIICEIDDSEFRQGTTAATTSVRGRKAINTIGPASTSVSVTVTEEEEDDSDESAVVITVQAPQTEIMVVEETPLEEEAIKEEKQELQSLPLNETSDEEENLNEEEEIVSPISMEKEERQSLLSSKLKKASSAKKDKKN
jgi:hypothetical protein